jgi:hypothetical protein
VVLRLWPAIGVVVLVGGDLSQLDYFFDPQLPVEFGMLEVHDSLFWKAETNAD